jgi:hypothetical protein
MDAFQILVIILSVALAISLILGIVVLVYIIKIVQTVKAMSDKASTAVTNISNVTASVGKFLTPAAVGKLMVEAIQKFVKNHEKKGK